MTSDTTEGAGSEPVLQVVLHCAGPPYWTQRSLLALDRYTDVPFGVIAVVEHQDTAVGRLLSAAETPVLRIVQPEDAQETLDDRAGGLAGVAVLHDDAIVGPGWASNLLSALEGNPDAAAVGPVTNHGPAPQGSVWLDSCLDQDLLAFARHHNWPDPRRWFEVEGLARAVVLLRTPLGPAVRGFIQDPWAPSGVPAGAAGRFLCAADTFVFHAGQESLLPLSDPQDHPHLVADGRTHPILSPEAVPLLAPLGEVREPGSGDLDAFDRGDPIVLVRGRTPGVSLRLHGHRRQLVGPAGPLQRLGGVVVLTPEQLATTPRGEAIDTGELLDSGPPRPRMPVEPALRDLAMGPDALGARITAALDARSPLSLVRLGAAEEHLLDPWWVAGPADAPLLAYAGVVTPGDALRRRLMEAVRDADIVGVRMPPSHGHSRGAAWVLDHHSLHPRHLCTHDAPWELAMASAGSAAPVASVRLLRMLERRRVGVVGRRAADVLARRRALGWDITVAVDLSDERDLDAVAAELGDRREAFDLLLVGAGVPAVLLCSWAARALATVALDVGMVLEHLADPGVTPATATKAALRWHLCSYAADVTTPSRRTLEHPRNGTFVRNRDDGSLHYVEAGLCRPVSHERLPRLLGAPIGEVVGRELAALPPGPPVCIVVDPLEGPFLLLDGRRHPLDLGLDVGGIDPASLRALPRGEPIEWHPPPEVR